MDRMLARVVFLAVIGLSLVSNATATAAAPALRLDAQPLALRSRTGAPLFIDLQLNSRQRAMLEGVLELRMFADGAEIYRVQTPELALAPGTVRQRLLLPAGIGGAWSGSPPKLEAQCFFRMKKETHDLGRFPLGAETSDARDYVIGNCTKTSVSRSGQPRLWQGLRPELPVEGSRKVVRQINSVPVPFPPEDLPSALGLCAFDVIAVEKTAFAELNEKQMGALKTWVEAGGSLCVMATAPLDAEHVAFLNDLAREPGQPEALTPEPGGSLAVRGGPLLFRRPGIGRLVIAIAAPASDAEVTSPEWRQAASYLAKLRSNPQAAVVQSDPRVGWQYQARNAQELRLNTIRGALFQYLPKTSRMIPLPVIGAILGVFVLLVGPGEWILLGRLRRRRWTWITFPLLAVGFALLGVRTAEFYLGRNDKLATLVVTDVDREGRVVRENRFELRVAGRDKISGVDVRQGLSAVCAHLQTWHSTEPPIPTYQGQVPGRYTMSLPLQQWKPVLLRTMTLGPGTEPPDIHWPELKGEEDRKNPARVFGAQTQDGPWTISWFGGGSAGAKIHESLVGRISFHGDDGMTGAMTSPSGGPDLMDLAIGDPTDFRESLVFAWKNIPDGIHIVRRHLYAP